MCRLRSTEEASTHLEEVLLQRGETDASYTKTQEGQGQAGLEESTIGCVGLEWGGVFCILENR